MTVALLAVLALYVGAVGVVAARWFATRGLAGLLGVVPALWVFAEWCRGWVFTGFGWLSAGLQPDRFVAHGLCAGRRRLRNELAVLADGGRPRAARGRAVGASAPPGAAAVLLAYGARAAGSAAGRWTAPEPEPLSVALVQGAIPQDSQVRARADASDDRAVSQAHASRSAGEATRRSGPRPRYPMLYENMGGRSPRARARWPARGSDAHARDLQGVSERDPDPIVSERADRADEPAAVSTSSGTSCLSASTSRCRDFVRGWLQAHESAVHGCRARRGRSAAARRCSASGSRSRSATKTVRRRAAALPARRDAARKRQQRCVGSAIPSRRTSICRSRACARPRPAAIAACDEHGHLGRDRSARPRLGTLPQFEPGVLRSPCRASRGYALRALGKLAGRRARARDRARASACDTKFTMRPRT